MAQIPNDTRFIGINPTVNLRERRSARINRETQPHTMQDIADSVLPYKVFTALLTQSGESGPDVLSGGELIVGRTYSIKDTGSEFDFTNVGAPNNDYGTWFVAIGTTPTSWGDGGQLIYDTGAPRAIVLENTIGNIWFTYRGVGAYRCYSDNLFTLDKTTVFINDTINTKSIPSPLSMRVLCSIDASEQPVYLDIYTGTVDGTPENNVISHEGSTQYAVTLEIRVYN